MTLSSAPCHQLMRASSSPSAVVVTIAGETEIATSPLLRRHLLGLPAGNTVLDPSQVRLLGAPEGRESRTRSDGRHPSARCRTRSG